MEVHLDDRADGARKRAQNAIETYALSMYALLGHPSPGGGRIGQMAYEALPLLTPDDLRHPEKPNLAALGQLQQMVLADIGANRPRNMYGAEAARAAQAVGGTDGQRGGMGFGPLDAVRGSSARYRDLPAGDSVKGSGTSGGGSAVTAEFARSFAGTGMVGGTLRTFAEVGLDRSTFDAYRREGFSRADIADAANTAKALDWKNDRQAFDDLQRSTKPQRAAIVEIDYEKDEEKRKALIEQKHKSLHIHELPQAEQDRWQRNIDRVQGKGHGADQRHGVGAGAKGEEADLRAEVARGKERPAMAKVGVAILTESANKTDRAAAKQALDDFGATAAPVKTAQAKPPAAGPTTG